ncbi:unnamed protein product [Rotaria magnacalcarata]|uniref:G-protein coupled receptors family 1 profile domain-containing protein n=1 Tax=Rotaria magnacalcarata TaxID=392030 RepID=A0A816VKN7_9BILA|nr:unnamed protein product [Rotaria magnacalcarata]CAF3995702.1 unnamed protein product [Rotaria magnacalcarata]
MSFSWNTIEFVLVCFGIILTILLTIGGNLVVLFAFFNDSHLLTPSNNFLLSMAIADFLVGLICMPFYSYAQMKNFWPFGKLFCKIWITIDDIVTMASVLSIVAITIERYWSINHSVHYRRHTTKTRIRIFSLLIWLIPFLNFAPGIWLLESPQDTQLFNPFDNKTMKNDFECIGAYHSHTLYLIIAQVNFFAWPLVVIIVLNVLIVVNLYKRSHRFPAFASFRVPQHKQQKQQRPSIFREEYHQKIEEQEEEQQPHTQQIDSDAHIIAAVNEANCCLLNKTESEHSNNDIHLDNLSFDHKDMIAVPIDDGITELPSMPMSSLVELDSKQSTNIYSRFKHVFIPPSNQLQPLPIEHCSSKSTQTLRRSSTRKSSKKHSIFIWRNNSVITPPSDLELRLTTGTGEQRIVRRLRRDKRAATSLFTLVLVFMFFLLPYVVVVVVGRIFSIEKLTDTNGQVYSAAFWLLWLNSTVNPILYPFIQPRFREAYRKLFFRFTRRRRRLVLLIDDIQRTKEN